MLRLTTMSSAMKPEKSKRQKRRNARIGALFFIGLTAGALALTISTGSCAAETYRRGNLMTIVTGDRRYAARRLTACGLARSVLPEPAAAVPCQVWNLLPLVLISGFAVAWLLRDLAGLDSRYRD